MVNQLDSYSELTQKYNQYNEQQPVNQLKIYEGTGFSIQLAQLLLKMIYKAVDQFREEKKIEDESKSENWFKSIKNKKLNFYGKNFSIEKIFAIDERWWGVKEIFLGVKLGDLLAGDPERAARDRVPFGFILKSDDGDSKDIYIVIRGTQTLPEWFNNLNFNPKETHFLENEDFGTVHRGFNNIYTKRNPGKANTDIDDMPSMKGVIDDYIDAEKPDKESNVYITGHSLGAALATLAAVHVHSRDYFSKPPILYTFASPRVGTEKFAALFNPSLVPQAQLRQITAYRVINSEDIIATFPVASPRIFSKESSDPEIDEALQDLRENEFYRILDLVLSDKDFYHIGQTVSFSLHKKSILENHIVRTYLEALGVDFVV